MIIIRQGASLSDVINALQQLIGEVKKLREDIQPNAEGWRGGFTNVTTARGFDANATTVDEVADVVGTLVSDLLKTGLLR